MRDGRHPLRGFAVSLALAHGFADSPVLNAVTLTVLETTTFHAAMPHSTAASDSGRRNAANLSSNSRARSDTRE